MITYYNNNREKCKELMKRNYEKKRKTEHIEVPPELAETVHFEVI